MKYMFYNCRKLKRSWTYSGWNVSSVKDMSYMFYNCSRFKCPISSWNVSEVEHWEHMFDNSPMDMNYQLQPDFISYSLHSRMLDSQSDRGGKRKTRRKSKGSKKI